MKSHADHAAEVCLSIFRQRRHQLGGRDDRDAWVAGQLAVVIAEFVARDRPDTVAPFVPTSDDYELADHLIGVFDDCYDWDRLQGRKLETRLDRFAEEIEAYRNSIIANAATSQP